MPFGVLAMLLEGKEGFGAYQVDHEADAKVALQLGLLRGSQGVVLILDDQLMKSIEITLIQTQPQ